jgi:transposase
MCVIVIITILPFAFPRFDVPINNDHNRSKADILREEGTLNPAPEKVRDPKFREGDFFDPRDVVQVKYEMLRRVSVEKASVTDASDDYGVSRPTYYQAKADFEGAGIAGLVPKKRGPRGPHKIQSEVLAFLNTRLVPGEPIRARELARLIQQEFGFDVHPRTIERAVSGKKTSR